MDDQQGETQQILFNDFIPLPFRILFLIQLGTGFWFVLVTLCFNFTSLNILQLLNLSYTSHNYVQLHERVLTSVVHGEFATTVPAENQENSRLIRGIWNDFKSIAIVNTICWILFKLTPDQELFKFVKHGIPVVAFGYLIYRLFYRSTNTSGQIRMYTTMKRILLGGINSMTMRSNDILISDSMVSYAKVLNDFGLYIWNYYYSSEIPYNYHLEFGILCIPIAIRMRQCWVEYKLTNQDQHIYNLIKYATGLGPLLVNVLIKSTLLHDNDSGEREILMNKLTNLNRWWYFTSAINSTYSFIWDVKMDWNLELFDFLFQFNKKTNPYYRFQILRNRLAFDNKAIYYIIIVVDFILRFIWILKLFIINEEMKMDNIPYLYIFSTFLFGYDAYSFGYTVIELLEIYRRWFWCFIKLESDWIKLKINESEYEEIELKEPIGTKEG
ncbi:ERD1 [[Candida] subhashii]|uniref:ERD1 n=1 Tax=[Candida] subhashii TaxID=561895 RepID=A0A8J5UEH4_9ASCO|nr:ERD1 [[Candida] subhashii]KAG7661158.1 ERD1 [[Candida] subhashii]